MIGLGQGPFNLILCLHALGIHELFEKLPYFFSGSWGVLNGITPEMDTMISENIY